MGGKRNVILMVLLAAVLGGGTLGYSWKVESDSANSFPSRGYIWVSDENREDKPVLFSQGAVWKNALSDTVSFQDVQGNSVKVDCQSFAHYDDGAVSALSDGVLVNLDDAQTGEVVNHYAVSPQTLLFSSGSAYTLGEDTGLSFTDYIWKLSPEKYMIQSPDLSVHFADDDLRDAGRYLEVTYIDDGVIQIQTADNLWQTISTDCFVSLDNGQTVSLSQKNVTDSDGQVLIDFSKIVMNANSNIEVVPLTTELENVKESVIPHFDITAESGQEGESGTGGVNGNNGTVGDYGNDGAGGAAGTNGTAGTSGTNGSAGSAGSGGASGANGSGTTVPGTVLTYPTFNMGNWTVSATGCSGLIKVVNSDMLDAASSHASSIYLVDMSTNQKTYYPDTYVFTENAAGYAVSFTGLAPDHQYRLVVAATINTGLDKAEDYLRDFISKTFWTDSTGVYLEAGSATVSSVTVNAVKQSYAASSLSSATVYLYSTRAAALAATATNPGTSSALVGTATVNLGTTGGSYTFSQDRNGDALSSNTTYFARFSVSVGGTPLMPEQMLTVTTLKKSATVGAPTMTPNRESWGFDVSPGAVYDPNGGITQYSYEFYAESSVTTTNGVATLKGGASAVRTFSAASLAAFTAPLDGNMLLSKTGYYVRVVATFFDNEKNVSLTSALSNRAQVDGSQLPSVYFSNADGQSGSGNVPDTAAKLSAWYDQLYGTLHIIPGDNSAQVLLDNTHHPLVTIRASGYYYVQYPVYLSTDPALPAAGKYLVGTRNSATGQMDIALPGNAFSDAYEGKSGGVYGLRPNTQYQVIVTGDLSEDGQNAYEQNARVGSCVVETPDTVVCQAGWTNGNTTITGTALATTLTLTVASGDDTSAFNRQMETLNAVNLTLTAGLSANPGRTLATLNLTESNFRTELSGKVDSGILDAATSLGVLLKNGLPISENTFNVTSGALSSVSAVHITLSDASDYTVLAKNRTNQFEYASTASNDISRPNGSAADGAVYVNQFPLLDAVKDIQLSAAPDEVPAEERGFSSLTGVDTDSDGLKNDAYVMSPNYLNSGKLAKTITFYAFDYPDYYADYAATDGWAVSQSYGGRASGMPLCAVTAVKTVSGAEQGAWLGSITLDIPASGAMPQVKFIPQTVENYYNGLYGKDTKEANDAILAYNTSPGKITDSSGAHLYFYRDGLGDTPVNGHQFLFAWTLTYQLEEDVSTTVRYYPFSLSHEHQTNPQRYTPRSAAMDSPFEAPSIYALPYASDIGGATWAVYVYDPDGAVIKSGENATLFRRSTPVSATTISSDGTNAVTVPVHPSMEANWTIDTLLTTANQVTIPCAPGASSVPVAVGVQWYTDKYTNSGIGVLSGTTTGYTTTTLANSGKRQDVAGGGYLIPIYESAFTFYHDNTDFITDPLTTGITVTAREKVVDGSSSVNRYQVTVSGSAAVLEKGNAIRLTFSGKNASGADVSKEIDKYLSGVDGADPQTKDGVTTLTFNVLLSRDLSELAGCTNVSLAARLLYETGSEGFSHCAAGQTTAIRTYTDTTESSGVGVVLNQSGNYVFNDNGSNLTNQTLTGGSVLPRFGSFFNITSNLTMDSGTLSGSMQVDSTRHNKGVPRTKTVSFSLNQARGAYSGSLVLTPRHMNAKLITDAASLLDVDGKPTTTVPEVTPTIAYSKEGSNANSVFFDFVTSSNVSQIWFLLERRDTTTGNYQILQSTGSGWEDYTGGSTSASPNLEVLNAVPSGTATYTFANLSSDTAFRVTAYYLDSTTHTYKRLNMYDVSANELINRLDVSTFAEPLVQLTASYYAGSYTNKKAYSKVTVTQVSNYYYTLELQKKDGTLITYLECGKSEGSDPNSAAGNTAANVYDFGQDQTSVGLDQEGTHYYRGGVFQSKGFNTATHQLVTDSNQRVYLNYGEEYRIQVKVYDINKGPAYDGTTEDNLIRTGLDDSIRTFTVRNTASEVNMSGVFQILSDDSGIPLPTITFSPAFETNGATVRSNRCAVAVVRTRFVSGVPEYTDVTSQVDFGSEAQGSLATNSMNFGSTNRIRLRDSNQDLFQKDDVFTCYLYGIQDDISTTTTAGVPGVVDRDTILAGRSLTAVDTQMTTARIPVDFGTSELLATQSVTYTSSEINAGSVAVTKEGNSGFLISLQEPVNPAAITHMDWSVTAIYTTDKSDQQQSVTVSGTKTEIVQKQVATNTYQIALSPEFSELPADATVLSYTVTLAFYQAIYDQAGALSSYQQVSMKAGVGATVSDDGYRLTTVLNLDPVAAAASAELLQQPDVVEEKPKEELPKEELPKEELPKEETPKEEPPKEEPPKEEPPKEEPPKEEKPKEEKPKEEKPKEEKPTGGTTTGGTTTGGTTTDETTTGGTTTGGTTTGGATE